MSGDIPSRLVLYLTVFFLAMFSRRNTLALSEDCLKFDIAELEDYLLTLDFENVPTVNVMIGGFKCPATALPFGALKSDWARLLLLQRAQPNDPIFAEKLGRLFRILTIAYFRIEERFDVVEQRGATIDSSFKFNASMEAASTTGFNTLDEEQLTTGIGLSTLSTKFSMSELISTTSLPTLQTSTMKETTLIEESSTSESNLKIESSSRKKSKGRKDFVKDSTATTNILGTVTSSIHEKSTTGNVEDEQTTISIFASEVSITTGEVKRDFEKAVGRGDFPIPLDYSGFITSDENILSEEKDLNFTTIQYHNTTNLIFVKFQKSNGSMDSDTVINAPGDDYSKNRLNHILQTRKTVTSANEAKKYPILEKPPTDNDLWKYIISSRNATLPSVSSKSSSSFEMKEEKGVSKGTVRSKKRESLNNDFQRSFRWFYDLGKKDKKHRNTDWQDVHIQCKKHLDRK